MADDGRLIETDAARPVEDPDVVVDARRATARRKGLLFLLALFVALAVGGAGLHWGLIGSRSVTTENAYVNASTAQISAQVSGLIVETRVVETQNVRRGDLLIVIDPADALLNVARAEAQFAQTLQRVRQYFADNAVASADVAAKQAELDRAQDQFERRQRLARAGLLAQEALTVASSGLGVARANLNAARQALAGRRALTQGRDPENHPETLAARAVLEAARLELSRTRILAPIDGVVVQNRVQVGQKVEPGAPIMGVAPLMEAYVDANFKETQLRRMRVGQPVTLISDIYAGNVVYHGRVAGLGGGAGAAFAIVPAQNATGNWIKVVQRVPVRISLDRRELAAHPLRVGLSMRATVHLVGV